MGKKRKERLCRICKKRPVWVGGDVKNPGSVCKKCYHAHVWPDRMAPPRSKSAGGRHAGAKEGGEAEGAKQRATIDPRQAVEEGQEEI